MSLLEKALAVKAPRAPRSVVAEEELELAVAFFRGEVNYDQAAVALGRHHRNICGVLGAILRRGLIASLVKIERVTP